MVQRTVVVVVAHPDDAELTCCGAVARWIREGARAILIVATDGARGAKEIGIESRTMAQVRRREQKEAADVIGFADVIFLGFPDGELEDSAALRGALVEQIRRWRPDCVVVPDPLTVVYRNSYVNHRDHRVLGMATLDAMYPEASNASYFPEQLQIGLQTHKVPETLLASTESPNHWVDISDTMELRFEALRKHASQVQLWPDNGEAIIQQQREQARQAGAEHGVRFAEEYRRIVVNPLA